MMLLDLPLGWVELRGRDQLDVSTEGKGVFGPCG